MEKELINSPSQEEEDGRGRKGGERGKRMEGRGGKEKGREGKGGEEKYSIERLLLITRPRAPSFFLPRYGSL